MRRDSALARSGLALAVFAATCAAFWPAADAQFVNWDDGSAVTENDRLRGLDRASLEWMWTTSTLGHYQPLTWLSLGLDRARLGLTPPDFPEAAGFHRTSLLLHATGAVALYGLALALLPLARPGAARGRALTLAAAAAALLHAIHPLRCESVCWVTERRDVLSGLFFVLSVLAYVRGAPRAAAPAVPARRALVGLSAGALALGLVASSLSTDDPRRLALARPGALGLAGAAVAYGACVAASLPRGRGRAWLLACHALLWLSLLAKAWGIVMPALLLVIDAWPLRRWRRGQGLDRRAILDSALEKLPFAVLAVAFGRLARWAQTAQQGSVDFWSVHTLGERAVQALYGLAFYPIKTLLPFALVPLYPLPDELRLLEPRFLGAAAFSACVTLAALAAARRFPAGLAAWTAFAVIVSPVLGVQQTGPQLVADRYSYLSCIPFALLAGGALWAALERGGRPARLAGALALCALLGLGVLTWRQSRVWRSSESLWTHALARGTPSGLAYLNLGLVRADQARAATTPQERLALEDEALDLYRAGAALEPDIENFDLNTAAVLAERAGRLTGAERDALLQRAVELGARSIRTAEAKGLHDGRYHWHQGRFLFLAGDLDGALASFARAVALRPGWSAARLSLAGALVEQARRVGPARPLEALPRLEAALDHLEFASAAEPGGARHSALRAAARDLQWQVLLHLGRDAEAEAARLEALRAYAEIPPSDPRYEDALQRRRALERPE
jgi:hypothetical protein